MKRLVALWLVTVEVCAQTSRPLDEHYFDWHHTNADTFDKIDLQDFRKCTGSLAVLAYILADMPEKL